MSEIKSTSDFLSTEEGEQPKLSSGLNVLTILTFIGCALGFLSGIWSFIKADDSYKQLVAAQSNLENAPAFAKKFMGPEMVEMARKSAENKLPILLLTLAGVALCTWGAMEMRKLKKQGFALWAAGEFLPLVGAMIFLGTGMFSGFGLFILIVPIIFLILYAVQRKNLVY
jgi:hypothetical protein